MMDTIPSLLEFLRSAEQLKNTLRSGFTSEGRPESTAEHTWRLTLLAMLVEEHYPDLDMHRVLKICVIHDLGEAVNGDIAAVDQVAGEDKGDSERTDLLELLTPLPDALRNEILDLWDEYENASTAEARLAKALDKLETVLQHTQGKNPDDFDYGFNLDYGKKYTDLDELTRLLRASIDKDTQDRALDNNTMNGRERLS